MKKSSSSITRFILLFLGICGVQSFIQGQSLTATIDLAAEQFAVTNVDLNANGPNMLALDAALRQDEIRITYRLPKHSGDQFYLVEITATLDGVPLPIKPEHTTGAVNRRVTIDNPEVEQYIVWGYLLDEYIDLKGNLEISLQTQLQIDFECPESAPTFLTWQDQNKHVILAGVGVGSILAGQYFKSESDKVYSEYLAQETAEAAQPFYDDANGKNQTYLILTYTGTAILAGDLVWEVIRYNKYRRDTKDYERYCKGEEKSLSLRPAVISNDSGIGVGVKLKMNF